MLNISVWSEADLRYLVACPEHPDTPAVDCIVCEPVASEPAPEVADPWLQPSPWAPSVITGEDHLFPQAAREERPDDDPAPVATCNGRDCGGSPHE